MTDPRPTRPDPRAFPRLAGYQDHRRRWEANRYVYPVLSRRSGGLSIGVNLNPDKVCNFACVYCQVDRRPPGGSEADRRPPGGSEVDRRPPGGSEVAPPSAAVDLDRLAAELGHLLDDARSGLIWEHPRFAGTPEAYRRLNDVALSGDGEPTTFKRFDRVIDLVADALAARGLAEVKIVLITDAACLHHAHVRRGLARMDRANGEIWAKLDAGTEAFFRAVDRTRVPFRRVLKNLAEAAAARPIVIQTMLFRMHGAPPPDAEIDAYVARLRELEAVGTLKEVHLYTIARPPDEPWCTPLDDDAMDALGARVQAGVSAPVRVFYGPAGTPTRDGA